MGFRIETIMEKGKINWKGIVNLLHNHDKRIQDIEEHGGGGGGYDDTAIKRRITAVENGKQNLLTAGNGITILEDTISAVNILNDTKESTTTVWSSSKVKALFESLTGKVNVSIVATKPPTSSAVNNTMYYVGTESPYHIWFFVNDEYTDFGTTALDLSDYFTKDEVNDLLEDKVDKVTGKSLVLDTDITQITTNKTDIANIKDDENLTSFGKVKLEFDKKQDKITDSTLSELTNSTTVSSVSATDKTNKTFTLSALWIYIKGKITEVYYPVGAVVLNMGTNPSESFGGTWELLATGTKALYLDSTAGTAVSEELPDPQITLGNAGEKKIGDAGGKIMAFSYTTSGAGQWGFSYDSSSEKNKPKQELSCPVETASNHTHTATIGNSTYSDGGNVRAEGITVCAWKRTA